MMVVEEVQRQIANRALLAGDKLPSIRSYAARLGMAPSTVVEAYDRLVAEGLISARRGSGFYVSNVKQPFEIAQAGPHLDRVIDPLWVSRQSLDASLKHLKPGCGWMPADWMPQQAIRKAIRSQARANEEGLSDYGNARGLPELRNLLVRDWADEGLSLSPDQILLTSSGTQSIDLICRLLLRPGDCVLLDDPAYFNFQALLRAHRVTVIGVPLQKDGPDLEYFEKTLIRHKPSLYVTNSGLHNPTGVTLSLQKAHKLLKLAADHDLTIIEDEIFSAFEPEPSARLAALDGLSNVVRIGSYSKTLSASIRCGYIAAKPDWIEALTDLQVATNFGGPGPFAANMVFTVLRDGGYRRQLETTRTLLAKRRAEVAGKLDALGIRPWILPRGGFYLWCELPGNVSASTLARNALKEDIILAPGNAFSLTQTKDCFMRFNVSQMQSDDIFGRLSRLLDEI
ncbi:PLP-dependent aminotransferase family protein [Cohaesibacter gelatinilyticus]|uniref:DNA-binding transcriptional regulator, MocR family, contains an aminotransferase domain n=1 Tax=Cohaesibacter gelatinilyticus TaxID=372072 RepID=A0A285PIS3_9HYPH|nr:PLP-dependent aminotransferase family protein [Cohaesibacter gelatinilyticus]SNZ21624.1 DNA-binding transcriptional regulator, MocR family, contains an aminotransferase domain [Cohaesibacter gelatinilyticus]